MGYSKSLKNRNWWEMAFWMLVAAMVVAPPIYAQAVSLPSKELVTRTIVTNCPVEPVGKCMETAGLLQAVGSFYEVVIIVLIALLAAVVSLVYLSIRASSKRQIEEQFEKDLSSAWLQDRLQRKVDEATKLAMADLARRLEIAEGMLQRISQQRDRSEDADGGAIVVGGGDGAG
ncbi:hypothetical protein FKV24_006080 [Lysobacter maris]|uniref:Uncharacterized protein n=1 Tax=Marilutibacter maris TaxID=1605891 RepID=A0A508AX06_9GAMM|nr:hypothetical protein [Lysobacter maris]KAB8193905.1 hypothetical protein FKV24_006080 [Lysobacter maris]